jgi:hypothetical protein
MSFQLRFTQINYSADPLLHNDAPQSVGLLWTSDKLMADTSDNTQHSQETDIHVPGGIRTHSLSRRAAADLHL